MKKNPPMKTTAITNHRYSGTARSSLSGFMYCDIVAVSFSMFHKVKALRRYRILTGSTALDFCRTSKRQPYQSQSTPNKERTYIYVLLAATLARRQE